MEKNLTEKLYEELKKRKLFEEDEEIEDDDVDDNDDDVGGTPFQRKSHKLCNRQSLAVA